MKINLLLTFALCLLINISSIAQTYWFSYTTATYADLSSPVIVSVAGWDDFDTYSAALPFQFELFGTGFNTIYFYSDIVSFISDFSQFGIASYAYCGLVDNNTHTASISYQNNGTSPNRIFKIQVKNAAFYDNSFGTDYANYQLWLMETSNIVEIHYGPNSVQDSMSWQVPGASGPGVAIAVNPSQSLTLNGPAANPIAYASTNTLTINGAPANGMVYIFAPSGTLVNELEKNNSFLLYPNPNTGSFKVNIENLSANAVLSVIDITGKILYQTGAIDNLKTINLSLVPGMYFAEILDGEKLLRRSMIIK
jgi:hypothetical protein